MNAINQYIGLTGNSSDDLTYIYKTINLFDKFKSEELFEWYSRLTRRNMDIKINNKPSVSVNYILMSNSDVHNSLDDKFLTLLLLDCVEQINISEELELRIVDIINRSGAKLHKYVRRYANRLEFKSSVTEIIKINNNCAYYMAQEIISRNDSLEIFRCLLLKLKKQQYKDEIEKYIASQGIINETIFIHAIVCNVHNYRYINNVDINSISKIICYNHLSRFIDKSVITQQYLISIKYQPCILKYSNLLEIDNDLIDSLQVPSFMSKEEILFILLFNRTRFKQQEVQVIMNHGSIVSLEYLIRIDANISRMLTPDILQLENKLDLRKVYEKYGFELVRKNIEPQKQSNIDVYTQYRKLLEIIDDIEIHHDVDKNMFEMICKTKSYLYLTELEQIKLVEYFMTNVNIDNLMPLIQDLKQTSTKINEFVVSKIDQITNSEYKNLLYDYDTISKPRVEIDVNGDDVIKTLVNLSTKKIDISTVESFLKDLFAEYCFDFYGEYLPLIIKNLQKKEKTCRVIFKIQENVKAILDVGFFNPTYFISIKNVLNTIIKYRIQDNCSYCSKVRRNNDKIIILLAYYSKFFDKNFQIGNVNKKNRP